MNLSTEQVNTIVGSRSKRRVDGIYYLDAKLGPVSLSVEIGYRVDSYGIAADPRTGDVGEAPEVEIIYIEMIGAGADNRLLAKSMFTSKQLQRLTESCQRDCQRWQSKACEQQGSAAL